MTTRSFAPAIFLILTLIGLAPFLSVLLAGTIATTHGCVLNESSVHPCIVLGKDLGQILLALSMMGWFMLVSWPLALAGILGLAMTGLAALLRRLRSPDQRPPS